MDTHNVNEKKWSRTMSTKKKRTSRKKVVTHNVNEKKCFSQLSGGFELATLWPESQAPQHACDVQRHAGKHAQKSPVESASGHCTSALTRAIS